MRSNKKYFYKQEVLSKNYNMLIEIAKSDVKSTLDFLKQHLKGCLTRKLLRGLKCMEKIK
ncbi:Protein of unknown function [Bacillus wiedmannii]|uniref:Uncharacterized protein n=1 Tax=Bacillus wiedmannii TaxID=1890302 RepID=A0A1C4FAI7_9BACI|nr:Protein of unknown function [Bacillus wiedmannii]